MKEGGYPKQIYSVDETALYWKRMTFKIFIAKGNKSMPDLKASNDRLALLLRTDAASDFTLKPMLIQHSGILRAIKNFATSTLPVLYK